MRTVALVGATISTCRRTPRKAGLRPTISTPKRPTVEAGLSLEPPGLPSDSQGPCHTAGEEELSDSMGIIGVITFSVGMAFARFSTSQYHRMVGMPLDFWSGDRVLHPVVRAKVSDFK